MDLGIFVDLRNPPAWQVPWPDLYARALERIERAEELGARSVWFSEHHGFDDGYLPQPLTFAAAAAARTRRMRLGTAIVLGALRHPRHLAEEAAIVDLVSGGRLELGVGAGYGVPEYEAFGADITRRFSLTDAAVAEVRRLLDGDEVTPPPAQRPFPLWLGYQGPQGARRAGRLGVGLLSLNPASLAPYQVGLAEGGHDPATARMGGVVDLFVADDPEAAIPRLLPFVAHQRHTYQQLAAPGSPAITTELLAERVAAKGAIPGLPVVTAEQAVDLVRQRTEGLPVRHVYVWNSIAGMDDELAERHVELWCTVVQEAFTNRSD